MTSVRAGSTNSVWYHKKIQILYSWDEIKKYSRTFYWNILNYSFLELYKFILIVIFKDTLLLVWVELATLVRTPFPFPECFSRLFPNVWELLKNFIWKFTWNGININARLSTSRIKLSIRSAIKNVVYIAHFIVIISKFSTLIKNCNFDKKNAFFHENTNKIEYKTSAK